MQTIQITNQHEIKITKKGKSVIVAYGADKTSADNYQKAIEAIGSAVMHALACEGELPSGFRFD